MAVLVKHWRLMRICLSQQNFDSPGLRFGMEILFLLEQMLY